MAGALTIYLSYARKDGAKLAQRLKRDLEERGFDVWLDVSSLSSGSRWTKEIEAALDRSEVVLALLTAGSYVSEICRAEQLRALRLEKRVIPLLAQRDAEIPVYLEATVYQDFSNPADYATAFEKLVAELTSGQAGVALKPEYSETYVTAPPLPPNFVERPDVMETLRNALFTDAGGRRIAIVALTGMAGIGKTVLAQALCRDQVVQQAFPDGIIWNTAGKESAPNVLREVAKAFGDNLNRSESELSAINRYRIILQPKTALLVFDDVFSTDDIYPFLAESPRSKILFTTRDHSIAAALGAVEQEVPLLTEAESRDMLARWSGLTPDKLPPEADEVVNVCGHLPLALSMVGAMQRGKPPASWQRVVDLLHNARLDDIKGKFPGYPFGDLSRAIQRSVDALDPKARERYLALAVAGDTAIPVSLLSRLWSVDESEARSTSEHFVALSLAQRAGDSDAIQLHPVLVDYLYLQFPDHPALEGIRAAVHQSAGLIHTDLARFAAQIGERLAPYQKRPAVQQFVASLTQIPQAQPSSEPARKPDDALLRTLHGHAGTVNGVALMPDGRRAVSASGDFTVKLWDLESGNELRTFTGHTDTVWWVALTADGRWAVSASGDKTVRVWELETGRLLHMLEGHSGAVMGVAVTPDARRAVSAGGRTVKVWDLETARLLRTLAGHLQDVTCVALTPDGRRAVSGSIDTSLNGWDLENGRELFTLEGHSQSVLGVAVTPDARHAISASADRTLKVWDLETGRELRTLAGHTDSVTAVAVSADGRRAVSASADTTLKIWDLETGRELRTLRGHSDRVRAVALTPDGLRAISASADGTLKVWNIRVDSASVQAIPEGIDRLRFAYLATLDRPELFEILDHFDPAQLQQAIDRLRDAGDSADALAALERRFPNAAPNPLWQAWIETVHAGKLGRPERQPAT